MTNLTIVRHIESLMQLILFVPTNVASALEHGRTVSTVPASGSVAGGKRTVRQKLYRRSAL